MTITNAEIAETFELMADLLELQGANPFRVRSYRNSARVIRDLPEPVADIVAQDPKRLLEIDGIGESVAAKCQTLVQTGKLPQLEELRAQVPEGLLALLRIPGLGPKKAAALHKELGIQSVADLKKACREGRVRQLKGFGEKTEKAILENLSLAQQAEQRIFWADADQIVQQLLKHLKQAPGVEQAEVAGSYRRGRETVGDLDVLVVSTQPSKVMDQFAKFADVGEVLARGDTKMSIRTKRGLQIDLRVVPAESFGAALQYFTGSKAHNIELRSRARQRGLKINEYGVYRGEERIAGRTEEEVYAALGLPWIPPELREARQEFQWADQGKLPELVRLEEIRGDLHMHTSDSDGSASLEEMAEAAVRRRLRYIAITDHSPRVSMAHGLDPRRLRKQWRLIDELNDRYEGKLKILKGVECDILEKGGMDLPDDVLAEADWVVASIHYGQRQSRQQITERMLQAIEHPSVRVIAHPTGRLINRREPYQVDLETVFREAAQHGKFLEINATPDRLDLNDVHAAAARQHGVLLVISTDAHSPEGLDAMRYGVLQARRAGLSAQDVLNTRPWHEFSRLVWGKSG
ncbi:MAG: DNA polymerase/3'-5' exonuclease PolX [Pirellulaceae bacterium]|nr:MAG: DNA polymerase/3'-5' exonuclease PolX [Pirellulaceae bacterium]